MAIAPKRTLDFKLDNVAKGAMHAWIMMLACVHTCMQSYDIHIHICMHAPIHPYRLLVAGRQAGSNLDTVIISDVTCILNYSSTRIRYERSGVMSESPQPNHGPNTGVK